MYRVIVLTAAFCPPLASVCLANTAPQLAPSRWTAEPGLWQHDLYHTDGTRYKPDELQLLCRFIQPSRIEPEE